MPQKQQIVAWLKDAHALEQNLARVLEQHIKDARDLPELRQRLEQHLDETKIHGERIASCLDALGEAPSLVKTAMGGAVGLLEGMSTGVFRDELVKNAIAEYAMEHLEMASYSSLATAAEDSGLTDIARTCREIYGEEAEMADWLEEHIPELTRSHLAQDAASK